jgi:hypothetical protein
MAERRIGTTDSDYNTGGVSVGEVCAVVNAEVPVSSNDYGISSSGAVKISVAITVIAFYFFLRLILLPVFVNLITARSISRAITSCSFSPLVAAAAFNL